MYQSNHASAEGAMLCVGDTGYGENPERQGGQVNPLQDVLKEMLQTSLFSNVFHHRQNTERSLNFI